MALIHQLSTKFLIFGINSPKFTQKLQNLNNHSIKKFLKKQFFRSRTPKGIVT